MFLTLISCCSPSALASLPRRSSASRRSSMRRSRGRGTCVVSDTVVDSNAVSLSPPLAYGPIALRISDSNMGSLTPPTRAKSRQNGTLWTVGLKERFIGLRVRRVAAYAQAQEETGMSQPRLLLIDDEPALAEFLATAARESGFEPMVTGRDEDFRDAFLAERPDVVAVDLGMPGMDGVELLRFLASHDF